MRELEKILEEIDETIERYGKNPYIDEKVTDLCYGLNIAKDIIRKHMNDGWIPVEERMPEVGKRVLATYRKNRGEYDVAQDQLIKEFWCGKEEISWDSGLDSDIIAWRPLPEPYRPERSNGE